MRVLPAPVPVPVPLLLVLLLVLVVALWPIPATGFGDKSKVTDVLVVEGANATLTCELRSHLHGDTVRMVAWYRSNGKTLYSYDARGVKDPRSNEGTHWLSPDYAAGRITFSAKFNPSILTIRDVTRNLSDVYRCRVDFADSQTQNSRVNLSVIVPPEVPDIYDANGKRVEGWTTPFHVGDNTSFLCRTGGGQPHSNLIWWRGNALVSGQWSRDPNSGLVKNRLSLGPLVRQDLDTEFTCQATNHRLSPPRSTKIRLDLLLRPLSVNFVSPPASVTADSQQNITCRCVGSRPAAVITWWLGSRQLTPAAQKTLENANVTVSTLSWRPEITDAAHTLRCRAENPRLERSSLEVSLNVTVQYRPVVSVQYVNAEQKGAKPGDDVSFRCNIQAVPTFTAIEWLRQGQPVELDQTIKNLSIIGQTLTLQSVTRQAAGDISCQVTNRLGKTVSQPLAFRVEATPVCSTDAVETFHAARGEIVNLTCLVDSFPSASSFVWSLNGSAGVTLLTGSSDRVWLSSPSASGNTSRLSYRPQSAADFGAVMCRAVNLLGRQAEPCIFSVVMTESPSPPTNCTFTNITSTSLELVCQPGNSAGLRQQFAGLVAITDPRQTVSEVTTATPRLVLDGLKPDCNYTVSIYAFNNKGRSSAVIMTAATLQFHNSVEPLTFLTSVFYITPLHAVLLGVAATVLLLVVVIYLTLRLRHRRHRRRRPISATFSRVSLQPPTPSADSLDHKQKRQLEVLSDPVERDMAERLTASGDYGARPDEIVDFRPNIVRPYVPQDNIQLYIDKEAHERAYYLSAPSHTTPLCSGSSASSDTPAADTALSETNSSVGETTPLVHMPSNQRESSV